MTRILRPQGATWGHRFWWLNSIEKTASGKRCGNCRNCGNRKGCLRRLLLDDSHTCLESTKRFPQLPQRRRRALTPVHRARRNTTFLLLPPLDSTGNAEERRARCESVFGHRGRGLRHVGKSRFMNWGDPACLSAGCGLQRGESQLERQ